MTPDSSLVLGENGTAFALMPSNSIGIPGTGVVSFDIGSGAVNWTWQAPSGSADMVAATAGNGLVVKAFAFNNLGQRFAQIVRLDSNGQAAFDTWTSDSASIQYAFGDTWLALGSTEAISAPGLLWPNSSFPEPTVSVAGEAYRHFDFELFFCAANLCTPHQDTAFVYSQDNPPPPLGETNPTTNLTPGQQTTIRAEAFKSLKEAFAGLPVRFGIGGPSFNEVKVTGDGSSMVQGAEPCGQFPALPFPGFPIVSLVFYLKHMEQAQFALNVQISGPTPDNQAAFDSLAHAIGRGIGNTAAHELGHQLNLQGMDANPDTDPDALGTYNSGSCDGSKDPAQFTGSLLNGTAIHWEAVSAESLRRVIYAP